MTPKLDGGPCWVDLQRTFLSGETWPDGRLSAAEPLPSCNPFINLQCQDKSLVTLCGLESVAYQNSVMLKICFF